jgi:O-antigen ligase
MPPLVATILYLSIAIYLFQRDVRQPTTATGALWLPFLWMFISGSRFISQWLAIFGINVGAANASVEEGSPIDALFFLVLIVWAFYILFRRRVSLQEFIHRNRWVTFYLLFCLLAISWSDFQFVAFKRWIKLFGQPVMVLILLTEPDPLESISRMMKRCACFWMPISLLFINYFPNLGRGFDPWSGQPSDNGIAGNKNSLGCDCLILGLFFCWHFLRVWARDKGRARRDELILCAGFIAVIGWLVHLAQSSTSLATLVLGSAIMVIVSRKSIDRRRIGVNLAAILIIAGLVDYMFGIHKLIIHALGRNETLTGRTEIWDILRHWDLNPLIGVGYETFWLGPRVDKIESMIPGLILNEAHNGYLETYINMGLLGLVVTLTLLVNTYLKIQRLMVNNFDFARYRLAYLIVFIAYNWTETAFRTHAVPFFMFFLIAIDYPYRTLTQENARNITTTPEPVSPARPLIQTAQWRQAEV